MLLERVKAAIMRVETLLEKMEKEDNPTCLEDHLTAVDIRSIEHLYGENGLKVLYCLREKPSVVLPVVLTRLKQKKEEWRKNLTDFNVTWAEVHAKYHHRSLDYRSSDFKNRDLKSLTTKALVAEIENNSSIQSKKGRILPSLSVRKEQDCLISELELEYSDPDIHNDIYRLIKYSCVRRYSQEDTDRVMNIWKHFLEPMLGAPTRPDDTDALIEVEESVHIISDCFLHEAEPVAKSSERDSDSRLFYGNASFYVLLTLHYILYERLKKAKLCSSSDANKWRIGNATDSPDRYARFMNALNNLLDGSIEQEKFEDECLTILGPESYILFTLDKLISSIFKQLHGITNSEINNKLIQLYAHESARRSWTVMDNNSYFGNVRRLVPDANLFRLEYMPATVQLSIQLMKSSCFDKADEEGYHGGGD